MLIKAYSDLQVEQALKDYERKVSRRGAAPNRPASLAPGVTVKPTTLPAKPSTAKSSAARKAEGEKTAAARQANPAKLMKPTSSPLRRPLRPQAPVAPPSYQTIMRELRETKAKLNDLETIHVELRDMNDQLGRRFEELMNRLDGKQASQASSVRHGAAVQHPHSNNGPTMVRP